MGRKWGEGMGWDGLDGVDLEDIIDLCKAFGFWVLMWRIGIIKGDFLWQGGGIYWIFCCDTYGRVIEEVA